MHLLSAIGKLLRGVWTALDSAHAIRHGAPYSADAVRRRRAYRESLREGPKDPLAYPLVGSRQRPPWPAAEDL